MYLVNKSLSNISLSFMALTLLLILSHYGSLYHTVSKNCAKRHIRPLYVNLGGGTFLGTPLGVLTPSLIIYLLKLFLYHFLNFSQRHRCFEKLFNVNEMHDLNEAFIFHKQLTFCSSITLAN